QLLRHDELLDAVWGRQAVTQGVLSQSVRELRQALGDSAQAPRYIETKHRLGYRFVADVLRIDAARPDTALASAASEPGQQQVASSRTWRWMFALVAMLGLLAWQSW